MTPTFAAHDFLSIGSTQWGRKKNRRVQGRDRDMFKLVWTGFLDKAVPKSRAVLWELFWGLLFAWEWMATLNGRSLMFSTMTGFLAFSGHKTHSRHKAVVVRDRSSGCAAPGSERLLQAVLCCSTQRLSYIRYLFQSFL